MTGNGVDQRQNVRVLTPFTAALLEQPGPGALSIIDLSKGGALISSSRALQTDLPVRLAMSLGFARPVSLDARVVRGPQCRENASEYGLAFTELDEAVDQLLTETVLLHLSARLRDAHREALVIDRSAAVRRTIRHALGLFGVHGIAEGASPLDAVARLTHASAQNLTSFVGAPAGEIGAVDLATFIASEYPHVHVVLLVPAVDAPRSFTGAENRQIDIEILAKPWTPERVASFMLPRRSVAAQPQSVPR